MAVIVMTTKPRGFVASICHVIDEGHIDTWTYENHEDKIYFTHSAQQWNRRAYLRPNEGRGLVTFNVIKPKSKPVSRFVFAIYEGRFIEMLVAHFPTSFTLAAATPNPVDGDLLQ